MNIDRNLVGRNIKNARAEQGLTQYMLAKKADISQTQLSDYENGNKLPGLTSIAKIAQALGKSIDELCYGDASISPITTAPSIGRLITNCVYQLWKHNVLNVHILTEEENRLTSSFYIQPAVDLRYHSHAVIRLLETLDDYSNNAHTFNNPEVYLEQVLDSVSSEIEQELFGSNQIK